MARAPTKKKTTNGRKRIVRPYAARAREYQDLMERIGLNQTETGKIFEYASRTSRRYKRGEGKVPLSTMILLRLMAKGVITKRQVVLASAIHA
jgi:hypothetical protein